MRKTGLVLSVGLVFSASVFMCPALAIKPQSKPISHRLHQSAQASLSSDGATLAASISRCPSKLGFAGMRQSSVNNRIELYWVGELDTATRNLMQKLASHVAVFAASYRYCDELKAADALALKLGTNITFSAGPSSEGKGVEVQIGIPRGETVSSYQKRLGKLEGHGVPVVITSTVAPKAISYEMTVRTKR